MKNRIVRILFLYLITLGCRLNIYGQNITTVAGGVTGHGSYWGDGGPATDAALGYFGGLAVDDFGNVFIADGGNGRIRKVDGVTGIISTYAGTGVSGYNGDEIPATTAQLNGIGVLALDKQGNLYVNDANNYRIRKINRLTGIITTIAGIGIIGYSGDNGPATTAKITGASIVFDNLGNMFLGDGQNHVIRKVDASGIITTIAGSGNGGCAIDGVPSTAATINSAWLAIDNHRNLYFSTLDSCSSVNKISYTTGLITRVAGTDEHIGIPYTGDGISATTCRISPFGITVDDIGNLYISDYSNSRIEKVDTNGIIRTIAGTGIPGFSGDGGAASSAQIHWPQNVVLDKCNNVYIADFNNRRVRKVTFNPAPCTYLSVNEQNVKKEVSIYPNPANDELHIENIKPNTEYKLYDAVGAMKQQGALPQSNNTLPLRSLPPGMYLLHLTDSDGRRTVHKILKE